MHYRPSAPAIHLQKLIHNRSILLEFEDGWFLEEANHQIVLLKCRFLNLKSVIIKRTQRKKMQKNNVLNDLEEYLQILMHFVKKDWNQGQMTLDWDQTLLEREIDCYQIYRFRKDMSLSSESSTWQQFLSLILIRTKHEKADD